MGTQSLTHTRRQLGRARITANAALAAPEGRQVALKVVAPDMLAQCDAYDAADAAVKGAEAASAKETREALAAIKPATEAYESVIHAVAAKSGSRYAAASTFSTPDDFFHVAEDVESELEANAAQSWAQALLAHFQPILDAAMTEQHQASDALKALQTARVKREQAEGAARPVFLRFRRLVRGEFGRSSRQYRELLDKHGRANEDEEPPAGVAGAAGGAPPAP
jgi:hypothetical protein